MREVTGDLWTFQYPNTDPADYVRCITTNGTIRKDGCAVMGRGCAKQALLREPKLAKQLGVKLKHCGNVPVWLSMRLLTFPVKHNWWEKADLDLIAKSADYLATDANNLPQLSFILPRPGCGNGSRTWAEVQPLLANLPFNVIVINYPQS